MSKWMWELIRLILTVASPQIRESLCKLLDTLEEQAKKTDNAWDDVLVELLKIVLACPQSQQNVAKFLKDVVDTLPQTPHSKG
ncbi:hypothetical protein ES703_112699 [subsurface metagenome]